MTAAVTEREIRIPVNGRVPDLDSPSVSTRARARIPVTDRSGKIRTVRAWIRRNARRWWAWTARPLSLRAAWRLSRIDPKRIPLNHNVLHLLWRLSNATDRLAMFALVLAAPTALTGPLRWLAARPTRRFGFYLLAACFVLAALLT